MQQIDNKLEELKITCQQLEKLIILENDDLKDTDKLINEYKKNMLDYEYLLKKRYELKSKEIVKSKDKDLYDNEIDLYLIEYDKENKSRSYGIFLKDTSIYIGIIKYGGQYSDIIPPFGNIEYEIKKEYKGHKYALKALKLITDKIYQDDIDKVYISAYKSNIPSIKTIENFGGTLINKDENSLINNYECDLKKIKLLKL